MNAEKLSISLERLDEVLQRMARLLHAEMVQSMVGGITMSQFAVLKNLSDKSRVTVSGVAEELRVSLSAITALVDRLHKLGLVDRRRDEKDRRLVWLTLTEEGKNVILSCREARKRMIESHLRQLPEEDVDRLVQIYEKIVNLIAAEKK